MKAELDAEGVARYLQDHPEFLEHHADLLAQIHIPSPHGNRAISITERQMLALRDKVRQLEAKLAELIRFGEENDAIGGKVHELTMALMAAPDFRSALEVLYDHLAGAFAVPHVALRLWNAPRNGDGSEFGAVPDVLKDQVAAMHQPYCGASTGQAAVEWFGEQGGHVRSLALIPLRHDADVRGALALASEEAHRFYPEMGTLYLKRIGDLAASALMRHLA